MKKGIPGSQIVIMSIGNRLLRFSHNFQLIKMMKGDIPHCCSFSPRNDKKGTPLRSTPDLKSLPLDNRKCLLTRMILVDYN
ncbi:hypothetical protein FKM82_029749 [Ascaphus truei]